MHLREGLLLSPFPQVLWFFSLICVYNDNNDNNNSNDNDNDNDNDNAVAHLGEGPRGPGPPLFAEYLQKIYKKVTEMSIQKPF